MPPAAYDKVPFVVLQNIGEAQKGEIEHHRRRLLELETQGWYEYGRAVFSKGDAGWREVYGLAATIARGCDVTEDGTTQISFEVCPSKYYDDGWLMHVTNHIRHGCSWETYITTEQLAEAFSGSAT